MEVHKFVEGLLSVIFSAFVISLVVVTLIFVSEIRDNEVDSTKLDFVEIGNWLLVALMIVGAIFAIYHMVSGRNDEIVYKRRKLESYF